MRIILASGSPRRKELLSSLGLDFTVHVPFSDETREPRETPADYCRRVAIIKAIETLAEYRDALIIAADTIVSVRGEIFGKPKDRDDAFRMLKALQGRTHVVYTGLCVYDIQKLHSHVESTAVKFRKMSDDEIRSYIATGECDDKAGAYAIQGKGSLLVESIDGDYFNVMGLPVCRLGLMLKEFGINIL